MGSRDVRVFCDFETTGVHKGAWPIEVGVIVTTWDVEVISAFETLIAAPAEIRMTSEESWARDGAWAWVRPEAVEAQKFHKIPPMQVAMAPSIEAVSVSLRAFLKRFAPEGDGRMILHSDNLPFEWRFMESLLGNCGTATWPFHYCGRDTSVLLEAVGVQEPQDVPHRALQDTRLPVNTFREAWEKTRTSREE